MCIQARKLFDIVRTLEGGDVHFKKLENEWVQMKAGRASFRLASEAIQRRMIMLWASDLEIDITRRKVTRAQARIDLTAVEFDLLAFLGTEQSRNSDVSACLHLPIGLYHHSAA